jgi:WXG100 family type VII secretion target
MARILVPPEELRATASKMEGQGQQVDVLLQEMLTLVGNLEGQWEGVAQNTYYNRFNEQVPKAKADIAEIVEGLVKAMKRIADEFERVDQTVV